jgi:hypothetical protein
VVLDPMVWSKDCRLEELIVELVEVIVELVELMVQ